MLLRNTVTETSKFIVYSLHNILLLNLEVHKVIPNKAN